METGLFRDKELLSQRNACGFDRGGIYHSYQRQCGQMFLITP